MVSMPVTISSRATWRGPGVKPTGRQPTRPLEAAPHSPPRTHTDPRGRTAAALTKLSGGYGRPLASASAHDASRRSLGGGVCRGPARALPCRRAARQSGAGQPTSCRLGLASSALRPIRRPGQGPVLTVSLRPSRRRSGAQGRGRGRRPPPERVAAPGASPHQGIAAGRGLPGVPAEGAHRLISHHSGGGHWPLRQSPCLWVRPSCRPGGRRETGKGR